MQYKLLENVIKAIKRHDESHPNSNLTYSERKPDGFYYDHSYLFRCKCGFNVRYIKSMIGDENSTSHKAHKLLTSDSGCKLFVAAVIHDHNFDRDEIVNCQDCLISGIMKE